jgi:hypothetical protein
MSQYRTITIDAAAGSTPGSVNLPAPGSVFHCISATGSFRVSADNQAPVTLAAGRGFGRPARQGTSTEDNQPTRNVPNGNRIPGIGWQRLTFYNTSGVGISVTFYVGYDAFVSDLGVNVETFTPSVSAKDPSTYTKVTTVAVNATTLFNGVDAGNQRKQIVITNPGATDPVAGNTVDLLVSVGGTTGGNVPPGTSWTIVTNGSVSVNNPAANAVVARILETFYS